MAIRTYVFVAERAPSMWKIACMHPPISFFFLFRSQAFAGELVNMTQSLLLQASVNSHFDRYIAAGFYQLTKSVLGNGKVRDFVSYLQPSDFQLRSSNSSLVCMQLTALRYLAIHKESI